MNSTNLPYHKKALIIGGGESLRNFDFRLLHQLPKNIPIIVPNYVLFHLPVQANYWVTIDNKIAAQILNPPLFQRFPNTRFFRGVDSHNHNPYPQVTTLIRYTPPDEIDRIILDRDKITHRPSGLACVNLALHFRAQYIGIIGIDALGLKHYYEPKPGRPLTRVMPAVDYLLASKPHLPKGTQIRIGSPSELKGFPKLSPAKVLEWLKSQ